MPVDDLLERNVSWAKRKVGEDPEFFERLRHGQQPRVLYIGCADSRVPIEQVLDCKPGELFVHRNIANVVSYNDVNIAAVVQYAVEHLKVPDIVVCGHYGCGGVKAACDDNVVGGYIGDWLMITGWAKRWVEERFAEEGKPLPPHDQFLRLVVEENVRLQIKHLRNISVLRAQWARTPASPRLHGWAYDIATGLVTVVENGGAGSAKLAGEA